MCIFACVRGRPITFRGRREVSAFVLNILSVVCAGGADKKTLRTQVPRGIVDVCYRGVSTPPPTLPGARPLCISSPAGGGGVSEVILLLCYNMRSGGVERRFNFETSRRAGTSAPRKIARAHTRTQTLDY